MKKSFVAVTAAAALAALSIEARAQRFVRDTSAQPVVTDAVTDLMWQGCAVGLTGDDCESGEAAEYSWQEALAYCEALVWGGRTDWRLPNKVELRSIGNNHRTGPSIDTTAFPETPDNAFWSSSSCADDTSDAWYVYFFDGDVYNIAKYLTFYVRCVRGGP
jgi:hypothetical protein